jgi:hypothetical protein
MDRRFIGDELEGYLGLGYRRGDGRRASESSRSVSARDIGFLDEEECECECESIKGCVY